MYAVRLYIFFVLSFSTYFLSQTAEAKAKSSIFARTHPFYHFIKQKALKTINHIHNESKWLWFYLRLRTKNQKIDINGIPYSHSKHISVCVCGWHSTQTMYKNIENRQNEKNMNQMWKTLKRHNKWKKRN